jgi:hypothetical protein
MKIIPITDFENEYAITDKGTVIDLLDNSVKIPHIIKMFNINQPAVDLYKDGELIFTVTIRELVIKHFFGQSEYSKTRLLNNDNNDYSPYNIEVSNYHSATYVNKYNMIKPYPIYRYSDNGVYVINQSEIDEYMETKNKLAETHREASKEKRKLERQLKRRKTPLPGTPEREEWVKERKLIYKLNAKLKYIQQCSQKMNVPFNLTAKDIIEIHNLQNGLCAGTEEVIDLNKIFTIIPKVPEYGYVPNNVDLIKKLKQQYAPRKLKESKELREKPITFRVSEDEYNIIVERSKEKDLSVSEFIRDIIL